eukprot:3238806-Rhodomonas_salina.1
MKADSPTPRPLQTSLAFSPSRGGGGGGGGGGGRARPDRSEEAESESERIHDAKPDRAGEGGRAESDGACCCSRQHSLSRSSAGLDRSSAVQILSDHAELDLSSLFSPLFGWLSPLSLNFGCFLSPRNGRGSPSAQRLCACDYASCITSG